MEQDTMLLGSSYSLLEDEPDDTLLLVMLAADPGVFGVGEMPEDVPADEVLEEPEPVDWVAELQAYNDMAAMWDGGTTINGVTHEAGSIEVRNFIASLEAYEHYLRAYGGIAV